MPKMTRAALFPLVAACSLVPGALRAQPADVAALALYGGSDREQRLVKGARAQREINLSTRRSCSRISMRSPRRSTRSTG